jgi:hypothetical protein
MITRTALTGFYDCRVDVSVRLGQRQSVEQGDIEI